LQGSADANADADRRNHERRQDHIAPHALEREFYVVSKHVSSGSD